ncbi:hypothetical protein K402DRAFT_93930 [Aulographum hederae CBS 113979]|uniref:Uncharacterized protein n=1 Tax=Aulographum hederae CBS 113979 TaxID=1176131 RepID=A0A6G1GZU1_9PEZI|nr:hypothetical protein K402DRAFT_93930 [Aulographum hederae CBS 113979]
MFSSSLMSCAFSLRRRKSCWLRLSIIVCFRLTAFFSVCTSIISLRSFAASPSERCFSLSNCSSERCFSLFNWSCVRASSLSLLIMSSRMTVSSLFAFRSLV